MNSSYHQVPIERIDVWKTTFKSKKDPFQWLVIPFGLITALASFMTLMVDILWPFINYFMVAYLDNILIFSKIWEKHL